MTDLQQKIICLEKELEDATNALQSQSPDKLPENLCKPNKFDKHSKSSCHRAIVESNFSNTACEAEPCPLKSSDFCQCSCPPACLENRGKSNVSFEFLSNANTTPIKRSTENLDITEVADQTYTNMEHCYNPCAVRPYNMDPFYNQAMKSNNMNRYYSQAMKPNNENLYYDQAMNPNNMANDYTTLPKMCEQQPNSQRKNLFKKKKKILKNKKVTSPSVYYAQTYSVPFIKCNLKEEAQIHDSSGTMNRSYLAEMVSKQYKHEVLGDNISQQSQFSSPICRDIQPQARMPCEGACHFESDICSCCHGQFQNIDEYGNKQANIQTYMLQEVNAGSAFYDTNQYDLVPVKEKPVKIKKEPRANIDMKCWPENVRTKYRYHALNPVPPRNHYGARSRDDYTLRDKLDSYGRKMPATFNRTEPIRKILAKRRKEIYRRERSISIETSRSCCMDFGNVYTRKSCKKPRKLDSVQLLPRQQVPMKNAECLTTAINNSECQTEMSTIEEVTVNDNKTEATLNQIKSILQSVLDEVKGSSQTKALPAIENKPKKDAIVQKGSSRYNMQPSSFMNSITYSPYAMSPSPYVTPCSQQVSPRQFCSPHGGMKCFHNFPVFIQNPGRRHACSSCYRSSQAKPGCVRQATTTATNTDVVKEKHSRETEKLIKEIYKSMALTMDFTNNTSLSDYDETLKSQHSFTSPNVLKTEPKKQQPKIIQNVVQAVSELFMKKDMVDTSETFNTTINSKLLSHQTSMRSHVVNSTDTELRARKDRLEKYMRAKNRQPVLHEVDKKSYREATVQNANSYSELEQSSSEGDTVITAVTQAQQTTPEHKHVSVSIHCQQMRCWKMIETDSNLSTKFIVNYVVQYENG